MSFEIWPPIPPSPPCFSPLLPTVPLKIPSTMSPESGVNLQLTHTIPPRASMPPGFNPLAASIPPGFMPPVVEGMSSGKACALALALVHLGRTRQVLLGDQVAGDPRVIQARKYIDMAQRLLERVLNENLPDFIDNCVTWVDQNGIPKFDAACSPRVKAAQSLPSMVSTPMVPPPPPGQRPVSACNPPPNQNLGPDLFANPNLGQDPFANQNLGADPFANQNLGADPFANQNLGADPFAGQNQAGDLFAGQNQGGDPFADQNQGGDPFANQNQGGDPFGLLSPFRDPFANQNQGGQPMGSPHFGTPPPPANQLPPGGQCMPPPSRHRPGAQSLRNQRPSPPAFGNRLSLGNRNMRTPLSLGNRPPPPPPFQNQNGNNDSWVDGNIPANPPTPPNINEHLSPLRPPWGSFTTYEQRNVLRPILKCPLCQRLIKAAVSISTMEYLIDNEKEVKVRARFYNARGNLIVDDVEDLQCPQCQRPLEVQLNVIRGLDNTFGMELKLIPTGSQPPCVGGTAPPWEASQRMMSPPRTPNNSLPPPGVVTSTPLSQNRAGVSLLCQWCQTRSTVPLRTNIVRNGDDIEMSFGPDTRDGVRVWCPQCSNGSPIQPTLSPGVNDIFNVTLHLSDLSECYQGPPTPQSSSGSSSCYMSLPQQLTPGGRAQGRQPGQPLPVSRNLMNFGLQSPQRPPPVSPNLMSFGSPQRRHPGSGHCDMVIQRPR